MASVVLGMQQKLDFMQYKNSAVLISLLYIAAKPKRIKMVVPTIRYTMLGYSNILRASKLHHWFKSYGHFTKVD